MNAKEFLIKKMGLETYEESFPKSFTLCEILESMEEYKSQDKVDALIEKYEKHVKSLEIGLLQSTSKQQVYERNEEISLFKHFIEDLESLKDTNH